MKHVEQRLDRVDASFIFPSSIMLSRLVSQLHHIVVRSANEGTMIPRQMLRRLVEQQKVLSEYLHHSLSSGCALYADSCLLREVARCDRLPRSTARPSQKGLDGLIAEQPAEHVN